MVSPNFGSARFGRTGPVPRVSGPVRFDQNDPLTRDSGELRQIRLQIRNLRKKLGHIGLVRVGPGFYGPSYGSVAVFRPVRTGPGPDFRSGPTQTKSI